MTKLTSRIAFQIALGFVFAFLFGLAVDLLSTDSCGPGRIVLGLMYGAPIGAALGAGLPRLWTLRRSPLAALGFVPAALLSYGVAWLTLLAIDWQSRAGMSLIWPVLLVGLACMAAVSWAAWRITDLALSRQVKSTGV